MGRVMVWQNEQPTQVEMTWGLESVEPGGKPISLLRWEGREISNPCLIIANVAYMRGRVPNEARTANRCLRRSSTMRARAAPAPIGVGWRPIEILACQSEKERAEAYM